MRPSGARPNVHLVLRQGRVRDLRSGTVYGQDGEMIRTCVRAPEGAIEIEL
jgi:hypothetical protein